MAKIPSTPTAGSLTVSGNKQVSGTISWTKPTVPSGVTISSCVLTGTATASMSKGSATITVNGTTVTSGTQFTINLGTANNTTSVTTTAKGSGGNSKGTVSFSNLVYTVTYEEASQVKTYTVTFKDWDGSVLKTQTVEEGSSATAPSDPTRNGYDFTGWDTNFNNITSNLNVTAQYSIKSYTVTFKDWNGTTLKTETVNHGSNATAPSNPTREGYEFTGWDVSFNNVTSNLIVTAQYIDSGEPEKDAIEWTGVGTVATGLNSGIKHDNYKINLDWDNEYFDIILQSYTDTGNDVADTKVCSLRINNNTYDYYFSEGSIVLRQGLIDICECYPYVLPNTLRFSKDGIYCLYEEENVKIGEIEYSNDNVIYVLEDDEYNTDFSMNFDLVVSERPNEETEEDVIEWNGIGTVATGLRAHDVEHNNYKINIDWNTQCFDIIVTEDFNYLSGITNINIAYLDEIIIGSNIYNLTLYVNNDDINIIIYGPMDETPNYFIERNYPYTIRFTKEGVYILYGSTSHLIMERDYDLDTIYFNEDGIDNEPLSGNENGDYDVAFDLAVSEYSGQIEEPETPSGIIARYTASASGVLPTFNEGYQYTVDETVSNGIYTVELYSDTDFTSCSFNGKINLLTVEYLRVTNNVTDMSKMFNSCINLTTLDASNWNTSNVTNMNNMFQYCNKLTSLNIPNMKFDKLATITNFLQYSGIKQLNFSRNTLPEISMADFMNDATSLNVIKCENKNNITKVISHLPVRTVENPGKIITQVPISQFTELEIQALADKNWAISNEELVVVAKYKFAKDIYRSMIPVFNEEFINYFVDDEYLDTKDLTGMYKSLPNKSNGESGKADYTITADNIVTRTISVLVDDVKPYNIRFGSHVVNVSSTTKDRHKSGSIIEILDLNISTNYDAALMFNCCVNMINCNINGLNTDAALSMYGMFADCCKLTTLDIDHLNVTKVQDFEAMFSNCESLTSLDVSNFNTGKVTYMNYMFYNCYNLTTLDLSNFDTSEVNYMSYMFYNCSNLTTLDLSSFDTSKVIDMNCMFEGCCSLAKLDLSNFDTSKVTDMYSMFYDCSNLTTLDLSNFDTSQVTDMSYIFDSCTNLISVNMDNSDIDSINDIITAVPTRTANSMGTIKTGSIDPESVDYTKANSKYWNISSNAQQIKIAQYKFNSSIDTLPTFNSEFTYKYTDADNGDGTITRTITSDALPSSISFNGKTGLVNLSYLDTSNVTDMSGMFYNCSNLTLLDVSSFDTTNVTTIEIMFAYCSNLLTVTGLNDLDVSNVNNMGGLFSDCSNITEINVSDWDVSKVTNFGAIFRRCPKLTNIDVSKWDTSSGVIMSGIFTNDSSLIELDLSNWDMSHANSVSQMFYGCSSLMKLKMCANLNQDAVTTYWFGKCNSLNDVQLSDFDTYTINKVIDELPTRTANNQGSLIIPKIDNSINTSTADSKYWIVSPDPTNIRHMHLGDMVISNLYIGEVEIKKVCLGEIIIYENKQVATDKDTLYNEFTGALFILKEDALSYDEEELALNINNDITNVSYNEENLDIGGDK